MQMRLSLYIFLVFALLAITRLSAVDAKRVLAWGSNSAGLLLTGDNATSVNPVLLQESAFDNAEVVSIAAGSSFGVAANANGDIFTWGSNVVGQLGLGPSSSIMFAQQPIKLTSLGSSTGDSIVQVAASVDTAFALTASGLVWSWGSNTRGILGNGTSLPEGSFSTAPVWVSSREVDDFPLLDVTWIDCGAEYCGAQTTDKQVYMWGSNERGQLGVSTGGYQYVNVPRQINTTSIPNVHFTQISFGGRHILALTNESRIVSWGSNADGQLGLRSLSFGSFWPVYANWSAPDSGDKIVQVAAGEAHSLALTEAGKIYGWGLAQFYSLGYVPAFVQQLDPYPFQLLSYIWGKATSIAAISGTSYASSDRGRTYSWGVAANYLLGLNETTNSPGPLKLNLSAAPSDYIVSSIVASPFASNGFAFMELSTLPPTEEIVPGVPSTATPDNIEPPPYSPNNPVPRAPSTAGFTPTANSNSIHGAQAMTFILASVVSLLCLAA
jgi:alpha-tubulin suppressor-like RCC1 family protein